MTAGKAYEKSIGPTIPNFAFNSTMQSFLPESYEPQRTKLVARAFE